MEVNGLTAEEFNAAQNEPDQKKMNEVWGRVGMKGMHSVKKTKESTDGNVGGVGTTFENYDKKGVKQTAFMITHYEIQNGGKTIYTEGTTIYAGPGVPFAAREQDIGKSTLTTMDNGNVKMCMDANALIQMRCFCGCMFAKMYPMIKFQKAMQEVIAPKGDGSKCPPGKVTMKKDLSYRLKRAPATMAISDVKAPGTEQANENVQNAEVSKFTFTDLEEKKPCEFINARIAEFPNGKKAVLAHIQKGFVWTQCMKEKMGTDFCQAEHFGYCKQGHVRVTMADGGKQFDLKEGDIYYIPPGHDAECLEDAISVEFVPNVAK